MKKKNNKPLGREAVVKALIEAAAELFSKRGVKNVSLREISAHAGVNLGLIHRHFGSKEALRLSAQEYLSDKFQEQLGDPENFEDAFLRLRQVKDKRVIGMLTRSLLEDAVEGSFQNTYPVIENLLLLAKKEQEKGILKSDIRPEDIVIGLIAMGFGIELLKDVLFTATGAQKEINKIILNWLSLIKTV